MKKRFLFVAIIVLVVGFLVGYMDRVAIHNAWVLWNSPQFPAAKPFASSTRASVQVAGDTNSPVEGGVATSTHYILLSSPITVPKKVDPFANNGPLPAGVNLAVPFTSQAPTGDWGEPYQDAGEETAAIMVDAYYRGISGTIPSDQATRAIDAIVGYEDSSSGYSKDAGADETARFIKGYFKYHEVVVAPLTDVVQLKRALANGFPVIVPIDGKLLPNLNLRNGSPIYRMLVVKGYVKNMLMINDPGARNGADVIYTLTAFIHAVHDWNGGDFFHGKPVMIIIIPHAS